MTAGLKSGQMTSDSHADPRGFQEAMAALRASEERYRRLFEDDLTGDCVSTPEGRIITCNPAFLRIFGFASQEEALACNLRRLYPSPEEHARFLRLLQERGKLEGYEGLRLRQDGSQISVVENAVGSFDAAGALVEVRSYAFDDTVRRQAERALRASEERYRRLFEDDLTGDCVSTPEGRIITCNPAFLRIFGFASQEEALACNLRRLYPSPEEHARFLRLLQERGKLEGYEGLRLRQDGSQISVVENAVGSFDAAGALVEVRSYAFDDTVRRQAERGLADATERYRLLVELIPDAVLVSDEETLQYANQAAVRLFRAESVAEMIGRPLLALFHSDFHQRIGERSRLAAERNVPLPLERRRIVRVDGGLVDVEVAVAPCVFEGTREIVRVCRDISDRVRWEEDLLAKDEEISRHAERVESLNTALKVLLEHREQEARQKEENLRATMDKLVLPYLDGLKSSRLDEAQQGFVEILESNLRNISSSLARQLSTWHEKLTPTEVQVADMILGGKRSKEIAGILRVSESAVAFHRANIRAKLGLKKKATNLVSHLRSLSKR